MIIFYDKFILIQYHQSKIQYMMIFKRGLKYSSITSNFSLLSKFAFGIIKFKLPDLGQKIKEGTIKKLYIKEGDSVEEFQKIADVASDKQFTELTASNSGVIRKIYYQEEDVCQVGDLFLQIFTKDQAAVNIKAGQSSSQNQDPKPSVISQPKQVSIKQSGQILATPYVRGIIKKYGLDITKITGSGEGGRILQIDVQNLINKNQQQVSEPAPPQQRQKYNVKEEQDSQSTVKTQVKVVSGGSKVVSMSGFEKGMQKSMTQSNTIPHLYLHEQFDITEVEKMRKALKESNKKVTVMGILIKTFSLALKQYPKMNSLYNPQVKPFEYTIHPNHNISIAIDSSNGLVVPHIRNVNTLSLGDIQNQLERLRNLAKEAKLTSKQLQGGTICLSNIGTIGGTHACPLILPPQVCIVAIGKLQSVPKYKNGELVERKVINISYGCDHRIVDGATVARFSNHWKQLIENPYLSIAQMI